ncbi:MAG: hypothetical protein ACE37F_21355 [Nannocystaceae bacterium]|nr:hypothetical protein [bacterium]
MTLISTSSALLAAAFLAACSSGASGSSGTFNAPATSGDDFGSDGSSAPVTSDPTGEGETTLTGSTTLDPEETSSTTTGEDLPDGAALLQWSIDGNAIDYGSIPVDTSTTTAIVLENVGGSTATSIATGLIAGDFSFPGGYPGTDGDCGTELAPGETCRLDLRFGPTRVGPTQSGLVLEYYDGVNLGAPTQTEALVLAGAGQGESGNLLVNGDAEDGAVAPWVVGFGQANWQISDQAFGGMHAFEPTGAIAVTSLEQTVSLASYNDETTAAGLRYRVRARARSEGEHTYRVFINTQGENNYEPVASGTQTEWTLVEHAAELPVEATEFIVRLECANGGFAAGPCNILFDDVTLQMVYP